MSHGSWRTPIVPIRLGAMTSALEELGCGTELGSRGGPSLDRSCSINLGRLESSSE